MSKFSLENGRKALVVGSGFGGLAAAIRLRTMGYTVALVEALDDLGGRARGFDRKGYHFDAGPTVITAPYLINELFQQAGRDPQDYYELAPVDPFYRIKYHDGSSFDYVGDEDRLIENIRALSPQDVDGYRKLAQHAERIFDVGFTQLADQPFDHLNEMFRVIPQMIELGNYRTVYGLVKRYLKDERLRQAFSFQPLLVGGNPFSTTSIYLLIHWLERKWGVHFPKGGTSALIRAMAQLLTDLDVEVRVGQPVTEILVDRGIAQGVQLASGERIKADLVVFNGDPAFAYRKLIAPEFRHVHANWKLNLRRPSMSLFVSYFGTKKKYPHLAHHTILLGPRYKELLEDIFKRRILAQDFSLYLHAPTRTDETLAPEGCETFYVLSPVPNNLSGINWREAGPRYQEVIFDHLERTELPGLRDSLETSFFITPDYFQSELRSHQGAGFGLEPIFRQSAYFRFHNRSEDIKNLYFVGASTHPGAGVPGVLCSAKVLEKIVPRPPQLSTSGPELR